MCFTSNKTKLNEIFDKFKEFYNDINVIKIKIINKIFFFKLKFKHHLKRNWFSHEMKYNLVFFFN